jgi:hypothetical protein
MDASPTHSQPHPHPRPGRRATLPALLAILAAVAVLLAACGGDDDSGSGSTTTTAAAGSSSGEGPSDNGTGAVAFAKCMRDHGVTDFPDPSGQGQFTMGGGIQSNPNFQTAVQACQHLLPNGLNNGGGSGGNDSILAFAKCMRENGVPDFPDPTGGAINIGGVDVSSPAFQAASEKCSQQTGLRVGSGQ